MSRYVSIDARIHEQRCISQTQHTQDVHRFGSICGLVGVLLNGDALAGGLGGLVARIVECGKRVGRLSK
jgi:hypothetical protein